jgi:hypothetical protein
MSSMQKTYYAYLVKQVAFVAVILVIGGGVYWQFFMKMNSKSMDKLFEIHATASTHDSQAAKLEILKRADSSMLEILLVQMKSENPVTRGMAAQALGKTQSELAIDPLLKLIEDEDLEVRFTAADGFKSHGHLKLVRPLIAGKTLLSVYEGSVTASAQSKEVAVNAGQGTLIEAGQPPADPSSLPAAPKISAPAASEEILLKDIACAWNAVEEVDGYHLEIVKNPKFKDIVADVTTDKAQATASGPATDGPYYVRVSAFNSSGLEGMPSDTLTIMYLFHDKGK